MSLTNGQTMTIVQRGRSPRTVTVKATAKGRVWFDFPDVLQVGTSLKLEVTDGPDLQARVSQYNHLAGGMVEIRADL